MASASPQIDFITQIQHARSEVHTNFARLTANVNELEIKLLKELQKLEFEHRQQEGAIINSKRDSSSTSLGTLNTLQSVTKVLVLDWNNSIEQTLLKTFCKITVNTNASTTIDPIIHAPLPYTTFQIPLENSSTSSESDECAHNSMRLVDKYRAINKPDSCSSSRGNKYGQLDSARGVAIDLNNGEIFVADTGNNRVQVFNWGARCSQQFSHSKMVGPKGICVSESENRIFITLSQCDLVQSYRKDGSFVKEIDSYRSSSFDDPIGITVDDNCRVYVCDRRNDNVVVFDKDLHFITVLTKQVSRPRDIKVRGSEVMVLSGTDNCLHAYTRGGRFLRSIIETGQVGVANFFDVDSRDNILITDTRNNCVRIFNSKGFHICDIGAKGKGKGEFEYPTGIAVDDDDDSFVTICDRKHTQLQIFIP